MRPAGGHPCPVFIALACMYIWSSGHGYLRPTHISSELNQQMANACKYPWSILAPWSSIHEAVLDPEIQNWLSQGDALGSPCSLCICLGTVLEAQTHSGPTGAPYAAAAFEPGANGKRDESMSLVSDTPQADPKCTKFHPIQLSTINWSWVSN